MIFDGLWFAEQKARKQLKALKARFDPLIEEAKKDEPRRESLISEYFFERHLIGDPVDSMRADRLVRRAMKLGIEVPPQPSYPFSGDENDSWEVSNTGFIYLSRKGERDLMRDIRKEEMERLQHQTRWVNQVVIPLVGLFATIVGVIGAMIGFVSMRR